MAHIPTRREIEWQQARYAAGGSMGAGERALVEFVNEYETLSRRSVYGRSRRAALMGRDFGEAFDLWQRGALPYQLDPRFRRPGVAETSHIGMRMDRPAGGAPWSRRGAALDAGSFGRGEALRPGAMADPYRNPRIDDTRYRAEFEPRIRPESQDADPPLWRGMSGSQAAHLPGIRVDAYGRGSSRYMGSPWPEEAAS